MIDKSTFIRVLLLILILLMIPSSISSRPAAINQLTKAIGKVLLNGDKRSAVVIENKNHHELAVDEEVLIKTGNYNMVQFAGSRLPDCSHACGSCMPCRLVIVGSACASLTEAESCPISYRCMCNNKTYPVP